MDTMESFLQFSPKFLLKDESVCSSGATGVAAGFYAAAVENMERVLIPDFVERWQSLYRRGDAKSASTNK